MNVLVTDGENRSALAVTRSLGRMGCRVLVTGMAARTLASSSRFCAGGTKVSNPLINGSEYTQEIIQIAERERIDLIFPITEQTIYLLNTVRHSLPEFTILACPPAEKMDVISNKANLFRLAEKLQVPIPWTIHLDCHEDLGRALGEIKEYPVVIKPAFSKIRGRDRFLSAGVKYAQSREQLERLYANEASLRHPSLIQEKIIGPGTGLFTLFDVNRHLALFSHCRLREKPPSGGVSVVAQSVVLDPEMVQSSERLLSAAQWEGVAMVEFKRDLTDGKAKLMEINGRFWGSLQLAITCGIDFPVLLLNYLQGNGPSHTVKDYLVGHKQKWLLGTLDHLLIRLQKNNSDLNLPSNSPTKSRAVVDFFNLWEKNTSFDVCRADDMAPFLFELYLYFRSAFGGAG